MSAVLSVAATAAYILLCNKNKQTVEVAATEYNSKQAPDDYLPSADIRRLISECKHPGNRASSGYNEVLTRRERKAIVNSLARYKNELHEHELLLAASYS